MKNPSIKEITNLVVKHLKLYWTISEDITAYQNRTLKRLERCFKHINNKYFWDDEECLFNYTNSVQYSVYLYFLANTIYLQNGNCDICEKIYYLNKIMHGVDWYYQISLPDIFSCEHPVGSVLGRAKYSNNFFFYQGCTVGGSNGKYPIIGKNVVMYANTTILGECLIGDNVIFSADTFVLNEMIPSNSLVFGRSPELIIVTKEEDYIKLKTQHFWRED